MDIQQHNSVLVTGGRGFIGRAVQKLIAHSGRRVVSLDQMPVTNQSVEELSGEVICDIAEADQLHSVFEKERFDAIIHLAAILPTAAQRDPVLATRVNVEGSLNLLEMARQFGVRRFVFGSSLSIYGNYPAGRVVSETDRAAPEDVYGAAKLYVEQLGEAYRERYGLEFVSLRIGRVVGPGAQSATLAWRSQIFEFLRTREAAEIVMPYVASERILLVHVDDVARVLAALLHAPRLAHEVYNAPCESLVVGDLKRQVESLNSNIRVEVGDACASGNPRVLDWSRLQREFNLQIRPIFEQLTEVAGGMLF